MLPEAADLSAEPRAVTAFRETLRHFLGLKADTGDRLADVFAADGDWPMASCLKGYFMKLMCGGSFERKAAGALADARKAARARPPTPWEQRHMDALSAWCLGDLGQAIAGWEALLIEWPTDVLALRLSHFAHFYLGDAAGMRDSVARVLPCWDEEAPAFGYLLGLYAFGLEETGDYAAAEARGRAAVERNQADIWATHAVAHVMEMQGRAADGVEWLESLSDRWADCNNFAYHAWWHLALFHLAQGRIDAVLALYDTRIRAEQTDDYLDLSNAIALLWRLEEMGVDVGGRWAELADKAETKLDDRIFAFHDAHYLMALLAGGRTEAAARMLSSIEAGPDADATEAPIYREVGLPLARAIQAYAQGHHGEAADALLPVRRALFRIGGSHAQRDLFARLLIAAVLKADRFQEARALLAERTAANPAAPWGWQRLAQALDGLGDAGAAEKARRRAAALQAV